MNKKIFLLSFLLTAQNITPSWLSCCSDDAVAVRPAYAVTDISVDSADENSDTERSTTPARHIDQLVSVTAVALNRSTQETVTILVLSLPHAVDPYLQEGQLYTPRRQARN